MPFVKWTGSCNRLIICLLIYPTNKLSQILLCQVMLGPGPSFQFTTALLFHQYMEVLVIPSPSQ